MIYNLDNTKYARQREKQLHIKAVVKQTIPSFRI